MERLTIKEKNFANAFIDNKGNGTQAILNPPQGLENYSPGRYDVASIEASRVLRRARVKKYIESHAQGAASRVVTLSKKAKNESVKLNANLQLLDRAGIVGEKREEQANIPTKLIVNIIVPHGTDNQS